MLPILILLLGSDILQVIFALLGPRDMTTADPDIFAGYFYQARRENS